MFKRNKYNKLYPGWYDNGWIVIPLLASPLIVGAIAILVFAVDWK